MTLLAVLILTGACSKTDANPGGKEAPEAYDYGRLVSWQRTDERSVSSMLKNLAHEYDINLDSLDFIDEILDDKVISYRFVYTTVDIRGNSIKLSGDLAYMADSGNGFTTLESVSLFHPAFSTDEVHTIEHEDYAFLARSIHSALVVHPHYQGSFEGKNVPGRPVTVGEILLKARQAIDCEIAAINLLKQIFGVGLSETYYTENMGISCGAGVALATQYMLETDASLRRINRKHIKLRSTYCCEGCYSFTDLLAGLTAPVPVDPEDFSEIDLLRPTAVLAIIVGTYDTWKDMADGQGSTYFRGIDVRDYFSEDFLKFPFVENRELVGDIIEYFRRGDLNHHSGMFVKSGFSAREILNPALVEAGGVNTENPLIKELFRAISNNEVIKSGWEPICPLCISHSRADEFVPYEQADEIYQNLSIGGSNGNVKMQSADKLSHSQSNAYFFAKDLLLSKHPCHDII